MTYDSTIELIKSRRSLYPAQMDEEKRILDEDIWKLLELANYAPNHKLTEPWRFIVFSPEKVNEFYDGILQVSANWMSVDEVGKLSKKLEERRSKVSHIAVIVSNRDDDERVPEQEEEYATACAVQNMLLGMNSLNIIGYWGTGKAAFSREMHQFLGLSDREKCLGWLQLGVPKVLPPDSTRRTPGDIREKVIWK